MSDPSKDLTPSNMLWMDIISSQTSVAAVAPPEPVAVENVAGSAPKSRKRKAPTETDDESESEDDDTENDSIVQDDDQSVVQDEEAAAVPDEDLARQEAARLTAGIATETAAGRSLRPRRDIRPPRDPYIEAVKREMAVARESGDKEHEPFYQHFEREVLGNGDGESETESEESAVEEDDDYESESDDDSTSSEETR